MLVSSKHFNEVLLVTIAFKVCEEVKNVEGKGLGKG
jgi:hypothetical protein